MGIERRPAPPVSGRRTLVIIALLTLSSPAMVGCLDRIEAPRDLIPRGVFPDPVTVTASLEGVHVDGHPYIVKGVAYNPVPPPKHPEDGWAWVDHPDVFLADFKLMKQMGVNTVRIPHASGDTESMRDVLDAAHLLDLKVMLGVTGPQGQDVNDAGVRGRLAAEMLHLVDAYRRHPAILAWVIGSDVNYWYPETGNVDDWYRLVDDVARQIKARDSEHLVTTANHGLSDAESLAALAPSLDVIGVNQYVVDVEEWTRWILPRYANIFGAKPLIITEFGADRFDSSEHAEDEFAQAKVLSANWHALMDARDTFPVAGAVVFEFNDAWWKQGAVTTHDATRDWAPSPAVSLADGVFSEEWFGLVAWNPDGSRRTTLAYDTLRRAWADGQTHAPPSILNVGSETRGHLVTVTADVVTHGAVPADVTLIHRRENEEWGRTAMARMAGDTWAVTLGPFDGVAVIFYRVEAEDAYGRVRTTSVETGRTIPGFEATFAAVTIAVVILGIVRARRKVAP